MKQRTLKEVAEAGLVLGFEWIAMDGCGFVYLFETEPIKKCNSFDIYWRYLNEMLSLDLMGIEITDYPHAPEKSLLKLSEIVEAE